VKNLFVSAKICPNLSEPHAQEFGIDVNERIFKILYAGGFCISDNVESYGMFGDGIVVAESPEHFADIVEHYLDNPDERESIASRGHSLVKENHTGVHRVAQILAELDFGDLSNNLIQSYKDSIGG
jgi:spore maturation protein CgeB